MTAIRYLAGVVTAAALLTGCGGNSVPRTAEARPAPPDIASQVRPDPTLSAQVPGDMRGRGTIVIGSAIGNPPVAYYPAKGGAARGIDIDLSAAVARVLGLRVKRQQVGGPTLLTGLTSGRYDLGTADLTVTREREKVMDFVVYLNDGAAFVVRSDSPLRKVTDLTQLCGMTVGTGVGTTYERDLRASVGRCARAGRRPYRVNTYSDAAAHFLALRQGHVDVLMSTSSVLRYAAAHQPGLRYLNEFDRQPIGFAMKKGSPLARPVQLAVDRLIADGTYARILAQWNLSAAAVSRSAVSPAVRS
jgi:polar amino acid transport system substrate-binding protein